MNYKISFQEMGRLGMEKLSKQLPTTLEEKRKQFKELQKQSSFQRARNAIVETVNSFPKIHSTLLQKLYFYPHKQ
jgi:hypothetical protein